MRPSPGRDPLAASQEGRRPPWSEFRAALEAEGFRPTKGLGQNFLVDPNAARSIALDAGVGSGERVLEVGAGCGFLSVHLAALGVELLAVEIDERLAHVAERFLSARENVRLLVCDVLAGKHALSPRVLSELPRRGDWHLVSNLPYSIAAPLLVLLGRLENAPRTMSVLLQEEVAARVAAKPGESAWGALSARLALSYRARSGRRVAAQLFWPRPRVSSRVVHLVMDPTGRTTRDEVAHYDRLVEALFQRRRKQVSTTLTTILGGRDAARMMVEAAGVEPRARPQDLSPRELLSLSRFALWREPPPRE